MRIGDFVRLRTPTLTSVRPTLEGNNYLNMSTAARDRRVYRIASVKRLLELFREGQNVLVKPKRWEDPFENFILRSDVRLPRGDIKTLHLHESFYGQCWTLQSYSDAMWRIYSPKADGVRIRSTIRWLAQSLNRVPDGEAFIGEVRYLPSAELIEFARNAFCGTNGPSARACAGTLLVKRPAFRHEREVRLLFFRHAEARCDEDLFPYPVDPHSIIDQIMIDPRMSRRKANELRKRIRAEADFTGEIKRSLLYAPPPRLVISLNTPSIPLHRAVRNRQTGQDQR